MPIVDRAQCDPVDQKTVPLDDLREGIRVSPLHECRQQLGVREWLDGWRRLGRDSLCGCGGEGVGNVTSRGDSCRLFPPRERTASIRL